MTLPPEGEPATPSGRFIAGSPAEPGLVSAPPETMDESPTPRSPRAAWGSALAGAGLLLAVVELVQVVGSVVEGTAVPSTGPDGLAGDAWHRIGYAFLTNMTVGNALVLVVAVVLASAPMMLTPVGERRGGRLSSELAAIVVTLTAAALAIGAVLAVRTRLHQFALLHRPVPAYQRREMVTFLAGIVGGSLVAFILALTLPRAPRPIAEATANTPAQKRLPSRRDRRRANRAAGEPEAAQD